MKLKIKKIFLFALFFVLFFTPLLTIADETTGAKIEELSKQLSFPKSDTKWILGTLNQLLYDYWTELDDSPEDKTAIVLTRKIIRSDQFQYLFIDAPVDTAVQITKEVIKMTKLMNIRSLGDVIGIIENLTVQSSLKELFSTLLEHDLRINIGAIQGDYIAKDDSTQVLILQYVLSFKPTSSEGGDIAIEILSPNLILSPASIGSPGGVLGTPNSLEGDLPPFTMTVSGQISRADFDKYDWQGVPSITIEFPASVPDLGFRPQSFWQRHLWEPLETKINDSLYVVKKMFPGVDGIIGGINQASGAIKDAASFITGKISDFVNTDPDMQIAGFVASPLTSPDSGPIILPDLPQTSEPQSTNWTDAYWTQIQDIIEQIDNLSEQAEIFFLAGQPQTIPPVNPVKNEVSNEISQPPVVQPTNNQIPVQLTSQPIVFRADTSLGPAEPPYQPPQILITEIKTQSAFSVSDEYIELYNPNNFDVTVSGWSLRKKTSSGAESALVSSGKFTGRIFAFSYLLITPQAASTGDLHYSSSGYSIAPSNSILLYDKRGNLIDQAQSVSHPDYYSYGRKLSGEIGLANKYQQTGLPANDFETQLPTPGYANQKDTTSPQLSFISQASATTTATSAVFIIVSSEPECLFAYQIDNGSWQEKNGSATSSLTITLKNLALGNHCLNVKAKDAVDNWSVVLGQTWQIVLFTPLETPSLTGPATTTATTTPATSTPDINTTSTPATTTPATSTPATTTPATTTAPNQKPTAMFVYSPQEPKAQEPMLFNGSYSNDSDGAIIKFFWTFSDGFATTTQVSTVEHTFNQPGVFTAKLIVQDNQLAKSAAMSVSFIVEEGLAAKLLITEIQIRTPASTSEDFIEIFNPTPSDIDISDFQIKKKSSSGAEYSIRVLPDNSIIKAQGYFLWANTGYAPGGVIPDIISSQTISADNSVALLGLSKNIIDQVAWGAGVNQFVETAAFPDNPPENSTTTITRRKNGAGDFQDTNNNSADFILSDPSPTNSAGDTGNYLPPTLPANFTITTINQDNKNAASLSWTASSDPDTNPEKISYEILCSIQPLDNYFTTGTTTDLLFQATTSKQTAITMPDLFENLVFYFAIRSFDGLYYSPYAATTYLSPPALVSEFIAASSANRGTVDLFWTNTGAPQYIINYNNQSLTVNNDYSSSVITTTVSGLAGGQAVNFTIRSLNTAGTASATSTIAAATPLNSFQDNSDGTITDLYSGLMWVKDGSGFGAYNGAALTWEGAHLFANCLVLCNNNEFVLSATTTAEAKLTACQDKNGIKYTEWRLPSFKELAIIDPGSFQNIAPNQYWSASYTTYETNYPPATHQSLRLVNFSNGKVEFIIDDDHSALAYVLPVRVVSEVIPISGLEEETQYGCNKGIQDNGDYTYTDLCSGLMWTNSGVYQGSYGGAIQNAFASDFAGYTDWRLPNLRELLLTTGVLAKGYSFSSHWTTSPSGGLQWAINLAPPMMMGELFPAGKPSYFYAKFVRGQ